MSQTAIGDVLDSVVETECEQFFQHYLHDFVRSVHRCYHKQQKSKNLEYKVGLRMIDIQGIEVKCRNIGRFNSEHACKSF